MVKYKNIVIGGDITALMFAFINGYPIFFTNPQKPFRFDFLSPKLEISSNVNHEIISFNDSMLTGIPKYLLWEKIMFLHSLKGLAPLSNICKKIRYDGDRVVCSNEYSKVMEFKFDNCFYFGDDASHGFVLKSNIDEEEYLCYDYIAFNSGGKHEIDFIHTDDDFISEIWFYSSDRIDGNTPVRDACAVSKLTKEQMLDFDYSETMARFKVLKIMKDNGMKGKQNGYTKKGTPRHYDFRTTSIRRETHCINNEFKPTADCIKIQKTSEKDLLQSVCDAIKPYDLILGV